MASTNSAHVTPHPTTTVRYNSIGGVGCCNTRALVKKQR